jgi:hypothetical protein
MSRGLGKVQIIIKELFKEDPRAIYSTERLCCLVYGVDQVDKKHRVAVLRAIKSLARQSMPYLARAVHNNERNDSWYDWREWPTRSLKFDKAISDRPLKKNR